MRPWAVIISLLVFLFLGGCGERDKREKIGERPVGYTGPARFNPYLAAERYLREGGHAARGARVWGDFSDETGLVFMPSSFLINRSLAETVLEWVADGGTLILMLEGGDARRNDFTEDDSGGGLPDLNEFRGLAYLLEEMDLEVIDDDSGESTTFFFSDEQGPKEGHLARPFGKVLVESWVDDDVFTLEQEGRLLMKGDTAYFHDSDQQNRGRVAEISYGTGSLRIFAHARPFRNPYLTRRDHAAYLDELASEHSGREIVFLYGLGNDFFGMLWQRGKMVVISGFLLLLVWLWMRIPRFGPILVAQEETQNRYGDELTATARFLWRGRQIEHLINPLKSRLQAEFHGDLRAIAEESKLSEEEIKQALTGAVPRDLRSLLRTTKTLQTLLRR